MKTHLDKYIEADQTTQNIYAFRLKTNEKSLHTMASVQIYFAVSGAGLWRVKAQGQNTGRLGGFLGPGRPRAGLPWLLPWHRRQPTLAPALDSGGERLNN